MVDFLTKIFGLSVFAVFVLAFIFQGFGGSLPVNKTEKFNESVLVEKEIISEPTRVQADLSNDINLMSAKASELKQVQLTGFDNVYQLLAQGYRVFVTLDNSVLDERVYLDNSVILTEVFYIDKMVFTEKGGVRHGDDTAYFKEDFIKAFDASKRQALIYLR